MVERVGRQMDLGEQLLRLDSAMWDYLTTGNGKELDSLDVSLLNGFARSLVVGRYFTNEWIATYGNDFMTEEANRQKDIETKELIGFTHKDYRSATRLSGLSDQKLMGIESRGHYLIDVASGKKLMKGER